MSKIAGKQENIEGLIANLTNELKPVRRFPRPLYPALGWTGIAALYMAFVIYVLGPRSDIALQLQNAPYLFEIFMSLAISVSASFAAFWLCIPDMRGHKWMLAPPVVLLLAFALWTILRGLFDTFYVPSGFWNHCSTESLYFGVIPAAAIFALSLNGKTAHPRLLPFMNALAVGAMGYAGLRITCISEDIGHILTYHTAPYFVFTFLAILIGRRIYRW